MSELHVLAQELLLKFEGFPVSWEEFRSYASRYNILDTIQRMADVDFNRACLIFQAMDEITDECAA